MLKVHSVDLKQVLPLDNLHNWLYCICVVTFDLELGQTMECVYPKHVKLLDSEKSNVNYLSFPDSNSGCMGDTRYHFRFRCKSNARYTDYYSENYPDYLKPQSDYCYGYVNFRQVKDKLIRRGYFQKSVVILSHLPFMNLFYKIVEIAADAYFEHAEIGLEVVCHNIEKWSPPIAGQIINLPVKGIVLQTKIPMKTDYVKSEPNGVVKVSKVFIEDIECKNRTDNIKSDSIFTLHYPHTQEIFSVLSSVVTHLQVLWELVLLNQPLLVISSSPVITSLVVQWLTTSISPLKLSQEFRPYFTIHDSEFKEFTRQSQAPPQVILGITNPFFIKALSHWPNILKVTDINDGFPKSHKLKDPSYILKHEDIKPGLYSSFKLFLQTDKHLLKSLHKGMKIERPENIQSEIIRKFFLELTQSFIYPLERYIATLMPLRKQIVPFKGPPSMKTFSLEDFINSLESYGPQLTSGIKGDWIGLYRSFYSSPNFMSWLSQRHDEINVKLVEIHTEIVCSTDLSLWIQGKPEVELVDLIIQINSKLRDFKRGLFTITESQERNLRQQIKIIMSALAPDLQDMLLKSETGTGAPLSTQM